MNQAVISESELGVKEVFVFTDEGVQLINCKFIRMFGFNLENCKPLLILVYSRISNLIVSLQKLCRMDNNFNFQKIYLSGFKVKFV
jgi:hypothetical protein